MHRTGKQLTEVKLVGKSAYHKNKQQSFSKSLIIESAKVNLSIKDQPLLITGSISSHVRMLTMFMHEC